nr:NUDIX domain-containing protein [Micromonospora sp. AMSO1212t]
MPSVSVVVVDDRARILLVRHAEDGNGWAVPGGAVDIGESPAQAAVREIREEIGVRISRPRLLDVLGGPDYEVTYPNGDRVAYVTAVYQAIIADGEPVPTTRRSASWTGSPHRSWPVPISTASPGLCCGPPATWPGDGDRFAQRLRPTTADGSRRRRPGPGEYSRARTRVRPADGPAEQLRPPSAPPGHGPSRR